MLSSMLNAIFTPRTLGLALAALLSLPAGATAATTVTFDTPGIYTWTVPANVRSVSLDVVGASGGRSGAFCTPGHGGEVSGGDVFAPGDTFHIYVGGKGGDAVGNVGGSGGLNGGANGGTVVQAGAASAGGGGGGGETEVHASESTLQLYAGGGGGCGGFADGAGNGGNAGSAGAAGSGGIDGVAGGGGPGRYGHNSGGADAPVDTSAGASGAPGAGGNGSGSNSFLAGGGGGGAGFDGGGGGGAAASNDGSGGGGGGGGSLALADGLGGFETGTASTLGDGSVTITYSPQPAPAVTTGAPSALADTSAGVTGTIDPESLRTTYHFEYGPTTGYGRQTAESPLVGTVTANLAGLVPGTLYHYRLVATNASGTTDGADQTFETTGPPVVGTGTTSGVSQSAAVLTGTVNPEGHATTYHFEYGTTSSYGVQTPETAVGNGVSIQSVTTPLAALAPGTMFHYRLVATNASGTVDGPDRTFQTAAAPSGSGSPSAPVPPTATGTPAGVPPAATVNSGTGGNISLVGKITVRSGAVTFTLACHLAACRVNAMLAARVHKHSVTLGSAHAVIPGGGRRTIRLSLTPAGRRLQERSPRLTATLLVAPVSASGNGQAPRRFRLRLR